MPPLIFPVLQKFVLLVLLSGGDGGYSGLTATFDDKQACLHAAHEMLQSIAVQEAYCLPSSSDIQIPFKQ